MSVEGSLGNVEMVESVVVSDVRSTSKFEIESLLLGDVFDTAETPFRAEW